MRLTADGASDDIRGRIVGALPDKFVGTAVAPASLSGLLVAEVIHLLSGAETGPAFTAFYDALVPGGVLLITCASPYTYSMAFLESFEERESAGAAWPGNLTAEEV